MSKTKDLISFLEAMKTKFIIELNGYGLHEDAKVMDEIIQRLREYDELRRLAIDGGKVMEEFWSFLYSITGDSE